MRLLGDRVLVRIQEEEPEKLATGLYIPGQNKNKNIGDVIITGMETRIIKIGDKIKYHDHCGVPYEHQGKKCLILHESKDVISIF